MTTRNLKGKTRPLDDPYETYVVGEWEFRVLKHYSSPERENDLYARVYCATKSPFTGGSWDYGDAYVSDIRRAVQSLGGVFP